MNAKDYSKKLTLDQLVESNPDFFNKDFHGRLISGRPYLGVGEGWYGLVEAAAKKAGKGVYFQQIKEKFGGLRIYVNKGDQELHDLLDKLESLSYKICENCGSTEEVKTSGGWSKTLCEKCRA